MPGEKGPEIDQMVMRPSGAGITNSPMRLPVGPSKGWCGPGATLRSRLWKHSRHPTIETVDHSRTVNDADKILYVNCISEFTPKKKPIRRAEEFKIRKQWQFDQFMSNFSFDDFGFNTSSLLDYVLDCDFALSWHDFLRVNDRPLQAGSHRG